MNALTMTRRGLGLAALAGLLAGCAGMGKNGAASPATIGGTIEAIATGVSALAKALAANGGPLPQVAIAKITGWATAIERAAAAIPANATGAPAGTVKTIESLVNSVLDVLAGVTFPVPMVNAVVAALAVALPLLENLAGVFLPAGERVPLAAPAMGPREALGLLAAAPVLLKTR